MVACARAAALLLVVAGASYVPVGVASSVPPKGSHGAQPELEEAEGDGDSGGAQQGPQKVQPSAERAPQEVTSDSAGAGAPAGHRDPGGADSGPKKAPAAGQVGNDAESKAAGGPGDSGAGERGPEKAQAVAERAEPGPPQEATGDADRAEAPAGLGDSGGKEREPPQTQARQEHAGRGSPRQVTKDDAGSEAPAGHGDSAAESRPQKAQASAESKPQKAQASAESKPQKAQASAESKPQKTQARAELAERRPPQQVTTDAAGSDTSIGYRDSGGAEGEPQSAHGRTEPAEPEPRQVGTRAGARSEAPSGHGEHGAEHGLHEAHAVAEHSEHGGHGGHAEHHEHFSKLDINSGCMLLGGVTFVMALFQIVNVDDDDIRRYAWKVISNTISIFMAVLFFQGNNNMLVHYSEHALGLHGKQLCLIQFLHCIVYVVAMFVGIAAYSGALDREAPTDVTKKVWTFADASLTSYEKPLTEQEKELVRNRDQHKSTYVDDTGFEIAVVQKEVELERRKRNAQAWSTLLAHMAGFAAIAAGGSMQQSDYFRSSPRMSFIPVLVITGVLSAVFQLSRLVRACIRRQGNGEDIRLELVTETVAEAEEDTLALAISFLTTQVIRFHVTGQLPNAEGLEEPLQFEPTWRHVFAISRWGLVFVAVSIFLSCLRPHLKKFMGWCCGVKAAEGEDPLLLDVLDVALHASAMVFAWCIFAASRLAWIRAELFGLEVSSLDGRILLALGISFCCFGVVWVADWIDDHDEYRIFGDMISAIIGAVSVLVGFSWEHSFDGAVCAVVLLVEDRHDHKHLKFFLGLAIFALLLRPWRRYILNRSMQLDALKESRDHCKKMAEEKKKKQEEDKLEAAETDSDAEAAAKGKQAEASAAAKARSLRSGSNIQYSKVPTLLPPSAADARTAVACHQP